MTATSGFPADVLSGAEGDVQFGSQRVYTNPLMKNPQGAEAV